MEGKQQPGGGFVPPNTNLPSAPPPYQEVCGAQSADPYKSQMPQNSYSAPYPTASGAPSYYHQGQPQPPMNTGYPYAGGPIANAPMQFQQPSSTNASYPKVILAEYQFQCKRSNTIK